MPNLAKTIETLDWSAIAKMNADELRGVLLTLNFQAIDENNRKRRSAEIGSLKRKYKYHK